MMEDDYFSIRSRFGLVTVVIIMIVLSETVSKTVGIPVSILLFIIHFYLIFTGFYSRDDEYPNNQGDNYED